MPALGIKVDACPGRLNELFLYLKKLGVFYGQCSEICGFFHGFMPIVLEVIPKLSFYQFSVLTSVLTSTSPFSTKKTAHPDLIIEVEKGASIEASVEASIEASAEALIELTLQELGRKEVEKSKNSGRFGPPLDLSVMCILLIFLFTEK